jgi:hypothetical protein
MIYSEISIAPTGSITTASVFFIEPSSALAARKFQV